MRARTCEGTGAQTPFVHEITPAQCPVCGWHFPANQEPYTTVPRHTILTTGESELAEHVTLTMIEVGDGLTREGARFPTATELMVEVGKRVAQSVLEPK